MVFLSYEELLDKLKKGTRKGNRRKLNRRERALYHAAMAYAKLKKKIVNGIVVEKLLVIIEKLMETSGMRVFNRGFKKAVEMLRKCEEQGQEQGVFTWAPQLKHWLKDHDYIFWLGTVR